MPLLATFLLVGCGGSGSQGQGGQQEDHTTHHQSANVVLKMQPEGNSGVSGTASFEDTSEGVLVKLELSNLPRSNTFYLAHIHPGTCAQVETHEHGEGEYGHQHGGGGNPELGGGTHEHGASKEIEYPLSPVYADERGEGSSTTVLPKVAFDDLLFEDPMHLNVHAPGSGDPPPVACANLNEAL
jgi:hypothetical protein